MDVLGNEVSGLLVPKCVVVSKLEAFAMTCDEYHLLMGGGGLQALHNCSSSSVVLTLTPVETGPTGSSRLKQVKRLIAHKSRLSRIPFSLN